MKKILMVVLCLILVPMLFADDDPSAIPGHVFRLENVGSNQYTGPRSTPTLVDQIDLSAVNPVGYCWGITYDWERNGLWVTQWDPTYPWMYCIQKTSPCTKIDSVQLGTGVPPYRLGIGYGGSDVMYMAGFDGNIYQIDMTTGNGTLYRSTPWLSNEGLGFNVVDNAVYTGDWVVDLCAYAQPAQTGSWNTWVLLSPSGMSGAHGTSSPVWLFTVNEDVTQAQFFQHSLAAGIPNTTPDSVWELPAGMTQASTADCAFDGQYIYVLDQSGPDMIWVFDVGIVAIEEMSGDESPLLSGFAPDMPNPAKSYSRITYTTSKNSTVSLNIYDSAGRLVKTLVNRANEPAGTKTVYWDGKNNKLRNVANGIYFLKLDVAEKSTTHKLILIK